MEDDKIINPLEMAKSPDDVKKWFKENWVNYVMIGVFIFIGFVFGYGAYKGSIEQQCNDYIHDEILNKEVRGCLRQYGYVLDDKGFIDINMNREPAPSKNGSIIYGGVPIS